MTIRRLVGTRQAMDENACVAKIFAAPKACNSDRSRPHLILDALQNLISQ